MAHSVLETLLPAALVNSAIVVSVHPVAIFEVVGPAAFVDVTIRVGELTLIRGLPIAPLALVARSVFPLHGARAMSKSSSPLAKVGGSRARKCVHVSVFGPI